MTKAIALIIFIVLITIILAAVSCISIAGDADILAEEQFRQFKLDQLRGKSFEN